MTGKVISIQPARKGRTTPKMPRWWAMVTYVSETGPVPIVHRFEELHELHDLIEQGPDWNCIIDFQIGLAPARRGHSLTIEGSQKL